MISFPVEIIIHREYFEKPGKEEPFEAAELGKFYSFNPTFERKQLSEFKPEIDPDPIKDFEFEDDDDLLIEGYQNDIQVEEAVMEEGKLITNKGEVLVSYADNQWNLKTKRRKIFGKALINNFDLASFAESLEKHFKIQADGLLSKVNQVNDEQNKYLAFSNILSTVNDANWN